MNNIDHRVIATNI